MSILATRTDASSGEEASRAQDLRRNSPSRPVSTATRPIRRRSCSPAGTHRHPFVTAN